jgi:hypothetical protein
LFNAFRKSTLLENTMKIDNPELDLAWSFVEKTDRSIFLTGKAGTGKTTFLHQIKANSYKRMIVVAPTGVAAINAKGVTIHSFFQLPFGPIIPDGSQFQQRGNYKMRFGRQKIDIIKSLDLLIIDEISMVRADLLDGIDQVLRRYKDANKVFGGVQVLMIGDLQQLSPVVKPNEWSLLEPYYETAFFFSSQSFRQAGAIAIELQHIYRQDNQDFIKILNEIRNNRLSPQSITALNERYIPQFEAEENAGYITLTTHNNRAQKMNTIELCKLSTESYFYQAEIEGSFSEHAFPTGDRLELKLGAQVMFIKNDSSADKRYFNGKIGRITQLDAETITVKCPGDSDEIKVTREKWENIKYSINPDNKEIAEDIVGSFAQMPLRLAWAITIHKSQGLTFDKAIIDAEASFAHGQTYVALSRCRTLEGIVLKSRITENNIISDHQVDAYIRQVKDHPPTESDLNTSQKAFQLNLIADLFDYSSFTMPIKMCMSLYYKNRNSLAGNIIESLSNLLDNGVNALLRVNSSFKKQLSELSADIKQPEQSDVIQQRIQQAIGYFLKQTQETIKVPLDELTFSTDNKDINNKINKQLQAIQQQLEGKLTCFDGLLEGFNSQHYLKLKANAALQHSKPAKTKNEYIDSTEHPKLFEQLRAMRLAVSQAEDIAAFQVFSQKTLYEMCQYFPVTLEQLKDIHGMGKIRIEKYGQKIVTIIETYAKGNELQPREVQKKAKKENPTKGSTQRTSLDLYQGGLSIVDIAKQRGLVESTIAGHLADFIKTGELAVTDLIDNEKYQELRSEIEKIEFEGLSDLKAKITGDYSYADLRMVLNAMEFEAESS